MVEWLAPNKPIPVGSVRAQRDFLRNKENVYDRYTDPYRGGR